MLLSAAASFGAASYLMHPQWRADFPPGQVLAWLGWPPQEPFAPLVAASGPLAQTDFSQCRQFFPQGQPPAVPAAPGLRELCFSSFAVLHSGQTKTPVFAATRLNRQMLARAPQVQRQDRFYAEARLPKAERAELADYRGSGYSRGHMAPAGDMHTDEAMAQSFSLANMVPQDQAHNAGAWNRIEQDTRKYVMRAAGDVYVFTGPVYAGTPLAIGAGVAVPSHLFKLVYDDTTGRSWVHWQANHASAQPGPPIGYAEFVRRTGLRLLPWP
ncbi:DNA/RNA non-specific endonuclease [Orrella sp. JC864]|uniref:DNA/RNA non-specific endonuclease n=1 Tax=Orrella sp. JC864 TaxID=3120298 RepID=UPI003FA6E6D5